MVFHDFGEQCQSWRLIGAKSIFKNELVFLKPLPFSHTGIVGCFPSLVPCTLALKQKGLLHYSDLEQWLDIIFGDAHKGCSNRTHVSIKWSFPVK